MLACERERVSECDFLLLARLFDPCSGPLLAHERAHTPIHCPKSRSMTFKSVRSVLAHAHKKLIEQTIEGKGRGQHTHRFAKHKTARPISFAAGHVE